MTSKFEAYVKGEGGEDGAELLADIKKNTLAKNCYERYQEYERLSGRMSVAAIVTWLAAVAFLGLALILNINGVEHWVAMFAGLLMLTTGNHSSCQAEINDLHAENMLKNCMEVVKTERANNLFDELLQASEEGLEVKVKARPKKIKVKGTPGRPKKVEVKVKATKQPRTKDGKFAKRKTA